MARVCLYATEHPITGIDQTLSFLNATLFQNLTLCAFAGAAGKTDRRRTAKSVQIKFDEMVADIEKFRDAMRKVTVSQPSGLTSD